MRVSFSVAMILAGAVSMALNLYFARSLFAALPFVDRATRGQIRFRQQIYWGLIAFFFIAYLATAFAFSRDRALMGETFVGLVFLMGALAVGLGIRIQLRLVESLLRQMERLVPICAECRRVRIPDPEAGDTWQAVNLWFENDAVVTHSLCPDCAARQLAHHPMPDPAR